MSGYLGPYCNDDDEMHDDDAPERDDTTPDPFEELHAAGYRAYRDALSGGRWIVAKWDKALDVPVGHKLGSGATAIEAWEAARRRFYGGAAQ